ncbi:MAG: PA14 domain-containing protein [Candidatus Zhuqueibacterota bacterium]
MNYLMIPGMLCMLFFSNCSKQNSWALVPGDIITRWTPQVNPENPLPEYPRPQLVRNEWQNLNGLWEYAIRPVAEDCPADFDGEILVPFPVESALSGVKKPVGAENCLWYRRTFTLAPGWAGKHVHLNFGAVDWETTVWVNDHAIGRHRGGYDAFSYDITHALKSEDNEIVLRVWDPIDSGAQPRGKQVAKPGGIWYTSVTGIWQTVWLEPLAETHIESFKIRTNIDDSILSLNLVTTGDRENQRVQIKVKDGDQVAIEAESLWDETIDIYLDEEAKLWSPDSPFLYGLEITIYQSDTKMDEVTSYFGMRKISVEQAPDGAKRLFLNDTPLFHHGPLDQGWWPDGLYTAPTDEALRYDIEVTRQLGFNMARKHVKIEPARWYYWCDKLGLMVWQDMPSGDAYIGPNDPDIIRTEESAAQFKQELQQLIDGRYNHPSIVMWVPFNEGWGQFDTEGIVAWIKQYDSTRLVNNASGWTDRNTGDVNDIHAYPGPAAPANEPFRAAVLGEYGGLGLPLLDHSWRKEKNWGYRGYKTAEQLTEAYEILCRKLQPLRKNGLAAAVYTQTTDVEIEVNGLMTYDRAVIKMDTETVKKMNHGYLSPEFESTDDVFLKKAVVKLTGSAGGEIHYSLDGSLPGATSPLYSAPLEFSQTTTINAVTIWPENIRSRVSQFTCQKVELMPALKLSKPKPGLVVHYFEGAWDSLPDFSTLKAAAVKTCASFDLTPSPVDKNFGLRFEGFLRIPADGVYTFFTESDDGSALSIDAKPVVTNDGIHGMREESGKIALKAGYHLISVDYFQKEYGLGLMVRYAGPGIARQIIPAPVLFYSDKAGK